MSVLIEQIRAGRRRPLNLGGLSLTVRRPTDLEAAEMSYRTLGEAVRDMVRFVEDWHGVRSDHLFAGSGLSEVAFDRDLLREWLEDQPQLWGDFVAAIRSAYAEHDEAKKNS